MKLNIEGYFADARLKEQIQKQNLKYISSSGGVASIDSMNQ